MSKADVQRRHFELTVGTIQLLMSPSMLARGSHASGRLPPRFIHNGITRETA